MRDDASGKGYKAIVDSYKIVAIGSSSLVFAGREDMILKNSILSEPNTSEGCPYQREHNDNDQGYGNAND